jgi:diadenosine tetraphosphate (Ap4A) HIT family hydrolase
MRVLEKKRRKYWKRKRGKVCEFCDIKALKGQLIKKLEGKYWYVLAAKYPYLDGNVIIIPKRHVEQTRDLNENECLEFFDILNKAQKVLAKVFKTNSFNIAINIGPESGASIKHLHWQLVPRVKMNPNAQAIFNDFHFVTLDYKDLIKRINKVKVK